jgi:hypothetical protein
MPGISRNALVFRGLVGRLHFDGPCYGLELPIPEEEDEQVEGLINWPLFWLRKLLASKRRVLISLQAIHSGDCWHLKLPDNCIY